MTDKPNFETRRSSSDEDKLRRIHNILENWSLNRNDPDEVVNRREDISTIKAISRIIVEY